MQDLNNSFLFFVGNASQKWWSTKRKMSFVPLTQTNLPCTHAPCTHMPCTQIAGHRPKPVLYFPVTSTACRPSTSAPASQPRWAPSWPTSTPSTRTPPPPTTSRPATGFRHRTLGWVIQRFKILVYLSNNQWQNTNENKNTSFKKILSLCTLCAYTQGLVDIPFAQKHTTAVISFSMHSQDGLSCFELCGEEIFLGSRNAFLLPS